MRNLQVLYHKTGQLPGGRVSAISLDSITAHKFYGVNEKGLFAATDSEGVAFEDVTFQPDVAGLRGFDYLALNDEFCFAKEGTLSVYNPKINPDACEEVAFFDYPVAAMAWSPDQEIVAVVTEDLRCIVLNSVYDTLSDTNLLDSVEEQFVTVGWGKKETQFHGSEGKHARKAVETGMPITDDPCSRSEICWRGDGEYFVVIFSHGDLRLFKVFDKEGALKFTSERCHGLDGPMAWRPSGLWIAVPQLLAEDKYCVALFERNGLRHRELVLPFTRRQEIVERLAWSLDSEVLLVVSKCRSSGVQKIYLFTINNYHWYLKQTLQFDSAVDHVKWDPHPVNGKTLHVFLSSGEYHAIKWSFDFSRSVGRSPGDEAVVAVIDGSDVLLTNFRSFVIPPPMSSFKLQLPGEEKANAVVFLQPTKQDADTNQFAILSDANKLRFYSCVFESLKNQVTNKIKEVQLRNEMQITGNLVTYHWNLLDEQTFVYSSGRKVHLLKNTGESDEFDLGLNSVHNINSIDSQTLLIAFVDGAVKKLEFDLDAGKFLPNSLSDLFALPMPCERHEVVIREGTTTVYSLNPTVMLYRNGEQFLSDITSFCRIGNYLAVTTVDELKFVNVSDNHSTSERKIERGGLLVTIVPNDSRTVLQMPRGNLETIKPRTLSVEIVGRLLDSCEYAKCYDILRRERINLNLIVDHNPDKFFRNIERFVEQVNNPNWLNLFLAELRNEDVTRTLYQQQYAATASGSEERSSTSGYQCTEKIQFICERFCEVIERKFSHVAGLLLPTITSHVKRGDLETGLQLIWNLKCRESENGSLPLEGSLSAEEALKYLLYLVNVDDLFNVALGMYDFDLVLFVARKSQKDPKEYLPFMNGLKQLEETYRKFQIDLHLKRYTKAIANGVHCGAEHFDECLKVIRENLLFGQAMELLAPKDVRYQTIAAAYGDYLREKGKLLEAGYMYERSGDLEAAVSCAKKSLQWERCISLKRRMGSSEEEVVEFARNLLPTLVEKGLYEDAAEMCEKILKDLRRKLSILTEGCLFEKAYYACETEKDIDGVRESYDNHHAQLINALGEDLEMFRKQKLRLAEVRKEKAQRLLHPEENAFDVDCDLYSDTTSMRSSQHTGGTRSSGKSFRSSKNRRKHERKLLNLKEGNPFEDIALIDALHTLVVKLYGQQEAVKKTLHAAMVLNMNAHGRNLQKFYKSLLEEVKNSLDDIWIPEMIVSEQIVLNDEFDLRQLQKGQHFALISEYRGQQQQQVFVVGTRQRARFVSSLQSHISGLSQR